MKRAMLFVTACGPGGLLFGADSTAPSQWQPPPPRAPTCRALTRLAELQPAEKSLADTTTEEVVRAAARFLNRTGFTADKIDVASGTIVTRSVTGQTLLSSCGVNSYRSYVAHVTVSGPHLSVMLECLGSVGWEEHVERGVLLASHREQLGPCTLVSAGDAEIPRMIVEGTVLELAPQSPSPIVSKPL